ncbi:MAG: hypothetical protein IIV13_02470 [Bacteroidaceae bacterium]|nr:hypothetical protein [Bacteroidaceae bacterium]
MLCLKFLREEFQDGELVIQSVYLTLQHPFVVMLFCSRAYTFSTQQSIIAETAQIVQHNRTDCENE